jgi:hypothetical protein
MFGLLIDFGNAKKNSRHKFLYCPTCRGNDYEAYNYIPIVGG